MRYLSLLVFVLVFNGLNAQNGTISPYSFIGLGESQPSKTIEEIMMGGIGVAYSDGIQVGFSNPATYSSMQLTSFSVGAVNKNLYVTEGDNKSNGSISAVSYLSMGIPLGSNAGMLIGLMPQSNVGYSLVSTTEDDQGTVISSDLYRGSGATNRVFFGLGYEIFKGFSLGLEAEYVFGNIEHSILNQQRNVQYGTRYFTDSNVSGWRGKLGMLYQKEFKEQNYLSLGARATMSADASFSGEQYFYPVNLQVSEEIPVGDAPATEVDGMITYPVSLAVGIGYGKKNKWFAEFDYTHNGAPEQSGSAFQDADRFGYKDINRYAIGGSFTPKYNSINSYWARATYRMGFKYEESGILIDGNNNGQLSDITTFGMAFGVGLPLRSPGSKINLGVDFGRKGNPVNGLIEENYVNIRLGVSLLDKWFIKRKIN